MAKVVAKKLLLGQLLLLLVVVVSLVLTLLLLLMLSATELISGTGRAVHHVGRGEIPPLPVRVSCVVPVVVVLLAVVDVAVFVGLG